MSHALFSSGWYRVARLKPRLRPQVQLRRQSQRGQDWYVVIDGASDEVRRVNRSAWAFIGRLDGSRTVESIWQSLLELSADDAPGQDEIVQLLAQLAERHLLQFDSRADIETMFQRNQKTRRRKRVQRINPLAFRLPLGNPARLLDRLAPIGRAVFSAAGLVLWLALLAVATLSAALQVPELTAHAGELLRSTRWLLLAWVTYPLIKLVHELAHGLAVQRWGGQVREAGVILLLLMPVPFVNAAAADAFRSRRRRAVVSAAGVMAELTLAALALLVWVGLQPGLLRDTAMVVMVTGALSTLLVNGNPLLRFDGYYLLCDLLDLRNLGPRSTRWWGIWASRRLLGVAPATPVEAMPGERRWLIGYAPLAWLYRIALSLAILVWVGDEAPVLGALLGLWLLWSLVLRPGWQLLTLTAQQVGASPWPLRSGLRVLGTTALVLGVLTGLPLPFGTLAEGVVWLPEQARIRAGTDGFVTDLMVADGQQVARGDLLLRLRDERLAFEQARLDADRVDLETRLYRAMMSAPAEVPGLREQLGMAEAALARVVERQAALEVRAEVAGRVVLPLAEEQIGRYRSRGDLFGHIETGQPLQVRVVLPQDDADLIRARQGTIAVRLAGQASVTHPALLQRDMPAAVDQLPSPALGDTAGGRIVTRVDDPDGLATRQPVVQVDLQVPDARSPWVGARVDVRFDHGQLSLAGQLVRQFRQLVLTRVDLFG